jgi:hypothetical protein
MFTDWFKVYPQAYVSSQILRLRGFQWLPEPPLRWASLDAFRHTNTVIQQNG